MNARLVQGIFDDLNLSSRDRFAYPDTGVWDARRNTDEFVAAMPEWKRHGLLAFTLNLQGGSPTGYGNRDWVNSAFTPEGDLDPAYAGRLVKILDEADRLGMVVILGYFYFGQDQVLKDEASVIRATDTMTDWLLEKNYRNVLVEVNNECEGNYTHAILRRGRVHELVERVREHSRDGKRLLVSTSYGGNWIPDPEVVAASDFVLLHGNSVEDPARIREMVEETRALAAYRGQPIVFNEDDHFDFHLSENNFVAAVASGASWGYFDYRFEGEGFAEGYQSVPVDWGINSDRKRGFFQLLKEMTGGD